eukprot:7038125-Pyramimonas_sp.AAC.1
MLYSDQVRPDTQSTPIQSSPVQSSPGFSSGCSSCSSSDYGITGVIPLVVLLDFFCTAHPCANNGKGTRTPPWDPLGIARILHVVLESRRVTGRVDSWGLFSHHSSGMQVVDDAKAKEALFKNFFGA